MEPADKDDLFGEWYITAPSGDFITLNEPVVQARPEALALGCSKARFVEAPSYR